MQLDTSIINPTAARHFQLCAGHAPLVAIARKRLKPDATLCQILQILSVISFEKTPILQAFQSSDSESDLHDSSNRLILFDFKRTAMKGIMVETMWKNAAAA